MSAHAILGASGAARWLSCPGSVQLSNKAGPRKGSSYASEGHAAHTLAEMALQHQQDAKDLLDAVITTEDGTEFRVDHEMAAAVQVYLDHVRALQAKATEYGIEARVSLEPLTRFLGVDAEAFGTADFWAYLPDTRTLRVSDYKHGRGVAVSPVENAQGMYYALGVLVDVLSAPLARNVETVVIDIVQPRTGDPAIESWELSARDLRVWGMEVLVPGMARTQEASPPLRVGSWCRFCSARAMCPALRKSAMEQAQSEFSPMPPDPKSLTADQLAKVLDQADVIETWVKAVREEGFDRVKAGEAIPGYKLVAKRASRRWKDPSQTLGWLQDQLQPDDLGAVLTPQALRSVAQVEKALPADMWTQLEEQVEKKSSGETLVPEGSPRERVANTPAGLEFDVVS